MTVSDAKRVKAIEVENAKLKRMLAEQMLDNATLKEMLEKKLLTSKSRRDAVTWAVNQKQYSQRRACGLVGIAPKT